jgi:hypothetical protein
MVSEEIGADRKSRIEDMKTANTALTNFLNSNTTQVVMADLLTLTPLHGNVVRITSADFDISVPNTSDFDVAIRGRTFLSNSIRFTRTKVKTVVGVVVDSMDVTLYGDATTLVNGVSVIKAARTGELDGAVVRLDRAYMQVAGLLVGGLYQFSGAVSTVDVGRTEAKLTVNSQLELLNMMMPRNTYQPGCINTLYDTMCAVPKTPVTPAFANGGSTASRILWTELGVDLTQLPLGMIEFTTGANTGLYRTIKSATSSYIDLLNPFPLAPAGGDQFAVYRGCDKTYSSCNGFVIANPSAYVDIATPTGSYSIMTLRTTLAQPIDVDQILAFYGNSARVINYYPGSDGKTAGSKYYIYPSSTITTAITNTLATFTKTNVERYRGFPYIPSPDVMT